MANDSPISVKHDLEQMAEWLALEQIDLLAQVEAQVRFVHHTMRRIEKLRAATQAECCQAMATTVDKMRARLREIQLLVGAVPESSAD